MLSFESENVEYKSIYVDDIKKEIIAFANTSGGKIYIGVDNNRNVCGVDNPDIIIQQVSNTCRDSIKPDITLFVHYNVLTIENKYIIEINVQCGSHRPYYIAIKGLRPEGVYVRQGTSSVPASDTAIRKMIKETDGDNYEEMIRSRIKKILDVAAKEGNEVVILGAWGCGAFKNPVEVVARIFVELLKNYNFEIVEFALATINDVRSSAFARALQ